MSSEPETTHPTASNSATADPPQGNSNSGCGKIFRSELFWFLIFSVIVSIATICQMHRANRVFEQSHQRIIDQNKNCEELTESILRICKGIESDTSVTKEKRLSLIESLDTLNAKIVRQDFDQKISNLLEIESTKIQNEFEVLNLWCALLTVVFLIFSFFSIFKTNEMNRQGEEALKSLRATAKEANSKSDSIEEKVREAEARINKKEEELTENLKTEIRELENKIKEQGTTLATVNQGIDTASDKYKQIEDRQADLTKQIDDKVSEASKSISETIKTVVDKEVSSFLHNNGENIGNLIKEIKVINENFVNINSRIDRLVYERHLEEPSNGEELEDGDEIEEESPDDEGQD